MGRAREAYHAVSTGLSENVPKEHLRNADKAAWNIWREENLQEEDVLKAR